MAGFKNLRDLAIVNHNGGVPQIQEIITTYWLVSNSVLHSFGLTSNWKRLKNQNRTPETIARETFETYVGSERSKFHT